MKNSENWPKANESKDPISVEVLAAIERHARSDDNGEVCGLVYRDRYIPLRNVSGSKHRFYADPAELAVTLSRYGEPQAIFHTHPDGKLKLSAEDLRMWYYSNSTMIIGFLEKGRLRWKMYGNRGH
jgi:proteasome lid subunit RPN8/RPN11